MQSLKLQNHNYYPSRQITQSINIKPQVVPRKIALIECIASEFLELFTIYKFIVD
jgi:hypothetical protein